MLDWSPVLFLKLVIIEKGRESKMQFIVNLINLIFCSVESKTSPVTYIQVAENKHISMGIFVIREGQNIPLHDHPHMHGVIKCLSGRLKITSFTRKVPYKYNTMFLLSESFLGK